MAPTLPPELERSIVVDYIGWHDNQTLQSCALVCRRLGYWSQTRLFHTITIGMGSYSDGPPRWSSKRKVGRLIPILETSPHLLSLVRRIFLHDSPPQLLAALASFYEAGVLDNLKLLVSAPALRTLELHYLRWNAGYFRCLLAHCSSTLTELRLLNCRDYAGGVTDYALPSFTQQCRPLPRINKLTLFFSSGAIAVLNEPAFSVVLTHMRHLVYQGSPHDSLGPLLRRNGQNVECLTVDTSDETLKDFHFDLLPSLCRLECQFSLESVGNVFKRLPDANRVTDLVLGSSSNVWQNNNNSLGHHALGLRLEHLVLRKLLCLRAVVVEVMSWYEPQPVPPETREKREKIVRAIERVDGALELKGLLSWAWHERFRALSLSANNYPPTAFSTLTDALPAVQLGVIFESLFAFSCPVAHSASSGHIPRLLCSALGYLLPPPAVVSHIPAPLALRQVI
ncbi:hypothetical protein GGX14DRAFT_673577 [Mycena pura]|uniref:Uncharacterized protein n=1 Tax=Mycena pura TaxID=153505 RepID=A0AAD6UZX1_9AGAR|nr:hypothetical protein GGX14DRAFT_673577 [Mycena pura]